MGTQENETEGDSAKVDKSSQEPQGFIQCLLVEIRKLVRWIKFYKTFMRPLLNYIVHYIRMIFQMETPRDLPKVSIEEEKDETSSGSMEAETLINKSREEAESDNIFEETLEALRNQATAVTERHVNEDEQLKLLEDQYREMFEEIESRRSANKTTTVVHSEKTKELSLPIFLEFESDKFEEDVDEEEELARMKEEFKKQEEEQKRVHKEEMEKMKLKRLNRKNN